MSVELPVSVEDLHVIILILPKLFRKKSGVLVSVEDLHVIILILKYYVKSELI